MTRKYRIEEIFDFDENKKYFIIQKLNMLNEWSYTNSPRYETLEEAKSIVNVMKKYENRVFHYVDGEDT